MIDAYEQNLEDKVFGNFTLGMNEWKTASLDSLRNKKMNEWMKEWMKEWKNEKIKEWNGSEYHYLTRW